MEKLYFWFPPFSQGSQQSLGSLNIATLAGDLTVLKHGAHVYEEGAAHERIRLASSHEIMIQGPGKI